MTDCVALLRGINVGKSANRIAMADLRKLLERLGHSNVRTLLNSGNAVFRATRGNGPALAKAIENEISARLRLSVPVVVLTAAELDAIIKDNRLRQASAKPAQFLVAFVQRPEAFSKATELLSLAWEPEGLAIGSRAAYLWCANGIIESRVAKAFTKATGEAATTRNWAPVLKLQAMLADGEAD